MSDKLTLENFRKAFTITVLPEDEIFLGLPAVKGRQSLPPAPPPLVGIGQARRKVWKSGGAGSTMVGIICPPP